MYLGEKIHRDNLINNCHHFTVFLCFWSTMLKTALNGRNTTNWCKISGFNRHQPFVCWILIWLFILQMVIKWIPLNLLICVFLIMFCD